MTPARDPKQGLLWKPVVEPWLRSSACEILARVSLTRACCCLWHPGCGILAVVSWLRYPGCGVRGEVSWLWSFGSGILSVASWLWAPWLRSLG